MSYDQREAQIVIRGAVANVELAPRIDRRWFRPDGYAALGPDDLPPVGVARDERDPAGTAGGAGHPTGGADGSRRSASVRARLRALATRIAVRLGEVAPHDEAQALTHEYEAARDTLAQLIADPFPIEHTYFPPRVVQAQRPRKRLP